MDKKVELVASWLGTGSINIFGIPFAGKDTQGEVLAKMFDAELIAGGDILRHYPDQDKIKQLMSTGELFPTDFYLSIVLPFLSQPHFKDRPLILSSVGRLHGEEPTIIEAATQSGHQIKAAVSLELSKEEVWKRFDQAQILQDRGDRDDDRRDVLAKRLEEFEQKTLPVIGYYQNKGLLIKVDGMLNREQVTNEIINKLAERALAQSRSE